MDEFLFGLAGLHPQPCRFTHRALRGAEWDGIAAQGGPFSRFHRRTPRCGTHDSGNAEGRGVFAFTVLEIALPFPQTESMSKGLALVPFEAEMNQQILAIRSLPDGDYALAIDDIPVGAWSAGAFKAGINLAPLTTTPQYYQALEVKNLNDERAKEASRLRTAALVYYGSGLFDSGVDPKDATAVQEILNKRLQSFEGESWYGYIKQQYDAYFGIKADEDAILANLEKLYQKLYQANQPVARRYQLTRKP